MATKRPIRIFKVDGDLYYDSGLVSENTPRCGTMDGKLKKTVKEKEILLVLGAGKINDLAYQLAKK